MPEPIKPKPNDRALSKAQAVAVAASLTRISATDIARTLAKWRRRVPGFEERIRGAQEE